MLTLERLLDVLDDNKVKYPKKFKDIEINGYDSNRCERFSDEIRENIQDLLARGINYGFDSNIKSAIYELADMAAEMSKYNAALKLDDFKDKKQQITRKFKYDPIEKAQINAFIRTFVFDVIHQSVGAFKICKFAVYRPFGKGNQLRL